MSKINGDYDDRTGELWNATRARNAELALDQFCLVGFDGRTWSMIVRDGVDADSDAACALGDLIVNLLHVADRYGWDVDAIVEGARSCHAEEVHIEARAGDPS